MYNTLLKTHSQLIKPEKCGIKIFSRCVYWFNIYPQKQQYLTIIDLIKASVVTALTGSHYITDGHVFGLLFFFIALKAKFIHL